MRYSIGWRRLEASLQTEPSLRTGIPKEVFVIDREIRGGARAPDGRFLVIKPTTKRRDASVTVILNWFR
ncbi:MAG: hypothetical protein GWO24_18165, partial [Akkermansiaceae bacterium]|nr:hypothetical protein [Akkermansiaceae bacterium]